MDGLSFRALQGGFLVSLVSDEKSVVDLNRGFLLRDVTSLCFPASPRLSAETGCV